MWVYYMAYIDAYIKLRFEFINMAVSNCTGTELVCEVDSDAIQMQL